MKSSAIPPVATRVSAGQGIFQRAIVQHADRCSKRRAGYAHVHVPIIADEARLSPAAVPHLVNAYDGVNVKLDKCGGILEAKRWIDVAKSLGMKTMLGCMISSSVSITAAAHLSPLIDYADLDGTW